MKRMRDRHMSDRDEDRKRLSAKNPPPPVDTKQVPFRMHKNDFAVMKRLLKTDGWSFQAFTRSIIDAYLKRDPLIIKLMAEWREENMLSARAKDTYTFSRHERKELLDEIGDLEDEL